MVGMLLTVITNALLWAVVVLAHDAFDVNITFMLSPCSNDEVTYVAELVPTTTLFLYH